MLNLVTDRTLAHVNMLKKLNKKGWNNMTASERTAWYNEAAKGAYNYTDLNRVESAVAEIAPSLGLNLVTKTDWGLWDTPFKADMDRYLGNVVAIRDACPGDVTFPTLPDSMSRLDYRGANNIERVLEIAYKYVSSMVIGNAILGEAVLGNMVLGKNE